MMDRSKLLKRMYASGEGSGGCRPRLSGLVRFAWS